MSSSHQDKFITKLLIGIGLITASIFVILYACFNRTDNQDWYFWGIVASVGMTVGLLLMGSAFVHKVKADLIRRQKQQRDNKAAKTPTE